MALEDDEQAPEESKQRMTLLCFEIKQLIESNSKSKIGINSTHFLEVGQSLILLAPQAKKRTCTVVSNLRDAIACTVPADDGREVKWEVGSRLKASFWREHDAGYSYYTSVVGYDTIKGNRCLLIRHAKSLKRDQQRRYRRKSVEIPCYFYPIRIEEVGRGRRAKKRAVVDRSRFPGAITNISAGGCSMGTRATLDPGRLLKLEFELEDTGKITVFGKVCRTRKEGRHGSLIHVMFTKVSRNYLNQIYSFVYNYGSA